MPKMYIMLYFSYISIKKLQSKTKNKKNLVWVYFPSANVFLETKEKQETREYW